MSKDLGRLVRFAAVGALVAAVDFLAIWLLTFAVSRLTAVTIAYPIAVTGHFWLNRVWVFAAESIPVGVQIPRYILTVIICWLCTVGITALALSHLTPNVFLAKILALPCATALSFVLMRRFVFAPRPASGAK